MEVPRDEILKYAPTYVKLLNRYGREAWLYSNYQGHNFGIPTFNEGANRPRIGAWRMDWLHKVGIQQVPQTVGQMHEALYKMRYDDPDGDGKKDTYGWSPTIGHWSLAFTEIFAAYDVLAFDFMLHDGKVVWGGTLPGTRQALRTLHQWYQEDLLDPDFVLQTQEGDTESRFLAGRVGYIYPVDTWSNYDLSDAASLLSRLRALHPGSEMVPAPPLRDAAGQRRGRAWGGASHVMQFGKQVENEPQKVIRVLRMFEAVTRDPQLYLEARCGKEGVHWRNNLQRGITAIPPYDSDDRLRDQEMIAYSGFGCMFFYPCSLDETYHAPYDDPRSAAFDEAYCRTEWGMTNVLGKSDVVPSAGRYLEDLRNYQKTVFVEMVVGRRPVDDFDQFVMEFNRRGGDVIVREANEMYAQLQQIYARVGAGAQPPGANAPEKER
jgi:putative aldouronate transport system substrate-binding protein